MYITLGNDFFNICYLGSKQEFNNTLSNCEKGCILLGIDSQQEDKFAVVTIYTGTKHTDKLGIGLILEDHGLEPQILVLPFNKRLLIGYNALISCIDAEHGTKLFEIKLMSQFYSFIQLPNSLVIGIFENGVIAFNENGTTSWKYESDIVTHYEVTEDALFLEFLDCEPVIMNLKSGEVIE